MTGQRTAPMIKSVELPNRIQLQYVEQGDPAGIPVLLLHGVTDSWHSFELVLPHLPESIHAFALTQRGHGDADHPAAGYGPHEFASDVAAFMDASSLGRPSSLPFHEHLHRSAFFVGLSRTHSRTRAHGLVCYRVAKRSGDCGILGGCRFEAD